MIHIDRVALNMPMQQGRMRWLGQRTEVWDVIGWAGLGEENLLWVGMGKDRMGLDDMGW